MLKSFPDVFLALDVFVEFGFTGAAFATDFFATSRSGL
jgi:hypothetical protein